MRHITKFFYTLLLVMVLTVPATASEFMDIDIQLGEAILSRMLCKKKSEINFVSRVRENVYLFSVFYANKKARFFVGVYNDMLRVQGKDFQTTTCSIPYHFDPTSKCATVDYSVPDCPTTERIVVCSEKNIEEKKEEQFWNRSIPELLDEDLRRALQEENAANATSTTNATSPQQ